MKKALLIALALLLLASAFTACGDTVATETQAPEAESRPPETEGGSNDRYDASFDRSSVADDISADLRFDGETVTFFTRDDVEHWKYEMDADAIMNDTLYDAVYYRNKTVEERLGITITTIQQAGNYANRNTWNDTLRTAVNTKTGDFDAAAIYASQGSALALESMYYNVIDFPYINLEKPWWNQSMREELSLFNTLYYLAGDIAVTEITETFCLQYNKVIFDKYYGSSDVDLYKLVEEKKWTIDTMYDLVAGVHEDNNGDGIVNDGDLVGLWAKTAGYQESWNDAWVPAMGIAITTMVNGVPELSFYSERTIRAFESVKRVLASCPGTLNADTIVTSKFADGMALFNMSNLNAGSGLRDMKDAYGVLPLPMLEENQEGGYATTFGNVASLVTILSSLPEDRKDLVGATLELMAAESYKQVTPAYFEIALKTKYAESPEDSKMYDLILNSVKYSFGYCYSTVCLAELGSLFRIMSRDVAKTYEERAETYEQKLQDLIDGLDEAAFKAQYGG